MHGLIILLGAFVSAGALIGAFAGFHYARLYHREERRFFIIGDPTDPFNVIEVKGFQNLPKQCKN